MTSPHGRPPADSPTAVDALIIGAGLCGIYMLHRLRELGLKALILEAGDGPGGTWYWNRYPGARFDSESYTYGYSFSQEILDQWDWTEHFAPQPETLRYLNFVVDKLHLRDGMHFGTRVSRADWDEAACQWTVLSADQQRYQARYLCTATGMLSAATLPTIEGREDFQGQAFHTYYWPHEPVDLANRRVAVIGTGASGVQVIGAIADQVHSLSVFQRRPNWCAPLHNSSISAAEMAAIRTRYDEIFAQCAATPNGFLHGPDRRVMADLPVAERHALWEQLYASPGFGVWLGNFREILMDPEANAEYSAFIADKIRKRVNDPALAAKLIPRDHGFGTRRVPLETGYYEAYNRSNVHLIDINETPIERITATGIRTTDEEFEFDLIIYATGFDAVSGSIERIDIRGVDGQSLRTAWHDDPDTYLGAQVHGFPNLFTLAGPQGASVSTNFPPSIEGAVDWTAAFIDWLNRHGHSRVEATPEAQEAWGLEVRAGYERSLLTTTKSWFTGYNSNLPDHNRLRHLVYLGGAPAFREKLQAEADSAYAGFDCR